MKLKISCTCSLNSQNLKKCDFENERVHDIGQKLDVPQFCKTKRGKSGKCRLSASMETVAPIPGSSTTVNITGFRCKETKSMSFLTNTMTYRWKLWKIPFPPEKYWPKKERLNKDLSCDLLQQVAKPIAACDQNSVWHQTFHDRLYVLQIDRNRTTKKSYDPVWLLLNNNALHCDLHSYLLEKLQPG